MTTDRAAIGAHYTPGELADELVEVAFEPHLAPWTGALDEIPPGDLLRLNVVDMACGDGALLAAAVRYLTPILIGSMARAGFLLLPKQAARLIERCCIIGNDVDADAVALARKRLPKASITQGDALFDLDVEARGAPLVFLGNPPFLGVSKISGALGQSYRARLVDEFPTFRGRADLCVCFILRAADIINRAGVDGSMSFITTSTISQGDTRTAGLGHLCQPNETGVWSIWHAWKIRRWPGAANVCISIVHLMHERTGRKLGYGPNIDATYRRFLRASPDRTRFRAAVDPAGLTDTGARVPVMLDGRVIAPVSSHCWSSTI